MTSQDPIQMMAGKAALSRRRFLQFSGGIAGLGILSAATGCKKDETEDPYYLGSGDVGILNYAYLLEQIESAFYTRVIESQYSGMTISERGLLTDIRDHELAHREFFRNALNGNSIGDVTPNFDSINFADRASVLSAARTFEDLGVSAYNGAGKLIVSPEYLTIAGKIVSVEARHAAYIRELIQPGSFVEDGMLDANTRLEFARNPADVLALAKPFIVQAIDASGLPTS